MTPNELTSSVASARQEAHAYIDTVFDALQERLTAPPKPPAGTPVFREPTEEQCRDPRNKVGQNLTPDGVEILFRLLDSGAGYNSAGRKMSITQTAVRNRKGDWRSAGELKREKRFIPWLDTIA